jgi:hypothetical protein
MEEWKEDELEVLFTFFGWLAVKSTKTIESGLLTVSTHMANL